MSGKARREETNMTNNVFIIDRRYNSYGTHIGELDIG